MSKELIARDQVINTSRLLAEHHQSAQTSNIFSDDGTAQQIWFNINENLDAVTPLLVEQQGQDDLKQLSKWIAGQYLKLPFLLDDRKDDGYIRLSSAEACLKNLDLTGSPQHSIWVDTLSDLAQLVVHLDYHGLNDLSATAINQYLEISGDYGGLALFTFYKVFHAVSLAFSTLKTNHSPETIENYRRYIHQANNYCQSKQPFLIIMQGLSGTGKTTVSKEIAEQFDAIVLRTDVERKRMFGLSPLEDSSVAGVDIYTTAATEKTHSLIKQTANRLLEANISVVIDGASLKQAERTLFLTLANESNTPSIIVKCLTPRDVMRVRITKRQSSNVDASEAGVDLIEQQQQWEEPLTCDEKKKTIVIHTHKNDWKQQLQSALVSRLN